MSISLYIKEQEIDTVINSESIRIQLNKDSNDPQAKGTVSTNTLELTLEGSKIVNQYRADGITGGMGVFQGLPSTLKFSSGGKSTILIDGYLDLSDGSTVFGCDNATVKIVERGGNDWFKKKKNSFTYTFLASLSPGTPGSIANSDNVSIPYVVSTIPNTTELAVITLSVFVLSLQIRTVIKDLIELVAEILGVFTTLPAIGKALAYVAFLILLFIAMFKLIKALVNLIIQPIKYMAGMRLQTLAEKGCDYLGLDFQSSKFADPFWRDCVYIPEKNQSFDDGTDVLGIKTPNSPLQTGYPSGTFGDIIDLMNRLWNARETVGNSKCIVERIDKNTQAASYVIPAVEILTEQLNTDEMRSNTSIRFSTDLTEVNTIDQFKGTFSDIIVEHLAVENADMDLLSGERRIEVGVSQGKKKLDLTKPEAFINALVQAVEPIVNLLTKEAPSEMDGKLPESEFGDIIEKRLGTMLVSSDFPQVPKLVSFDIAPNPTNTKVKDDNAIRLTSNALYDESYFIDSFVQSAKLPEPNQWVKYKRDNIPFCIEDYFKVINNPFIFDSDGRKGKLISLDWGAENEEATIEYWIQRLYVRNLKETISTPVGL